MRIGSIVIHCHDFDRTVAFWQAALQYVPREPAKGGWVVPRDPQGKGSNLSCQGGARRPRSRSWVLSGWWPWGRGDILGGIERGPTSLCSRIQMATCSASWRRPTCRLTKR